MKEIFVSNTEPDGRLLISQGKNNIFILPELIDQFIGSLLSHSSSEGDMCSFKCDKTGCYLLNNNTQNNPIA